MSDQTAYASVEDLEAAEFDFGEETVDVDTKNGALKLRIRELTVGRRSKLLTGLTDENGNVKDVQEMQCRMFAAACVEPALTVKQTRRFLSKWPASQCDVVIEAQQRLGNDAPKEASAADADFQESD